jgi:hypothetical protein
MRAARKTFSYGLQWKDLKAHRTAASLLKMGMSLAASSEPRAFTATAIIFSRHYLITWTGTLPYS